MTNTIAEILYSKRASLAKQIYRKPTHQDAYMADYVFATVISIHNQNI